MQIIHSLFSMFQAIHRKNGCSSTLAPESENCLIYSNSSPGCAICKLGYTLNKDDDNTCVESAKIEKCVHSYISDGEEYCGVCDKSYPAEDRRSCVEYAGGEGAGCLWSSGKGRCYKCEDGKILNPDGVCVDNLRSISGCLRFWYDEGQFGVPKCWTCDFYGGYGNLGKYSCSK